MTLAAGTRLGPYAIVEPLGAGGMGEVYRARDTRLDRTVAVKVLPAALSSDPQFRDRFDREARSISALTHPNVCTLYDVGREGDVAYLVMELIDGETLAVRLARGPLPLADALRIATEIASALDKAHRLGIVHRDLKPGNVMLARGGSATAPPIAKLLDFGLAKTGAAAPLATLPTALAGPAPITEKGTVLGTFQYMAPEQIEGDEADARTDLFAFGAVLYEMLTGRRAFDGRSQASLIGAILKDDPPPVSAALPVAPPALDYLIRSCLAKDREARIQSAHDVLLQLRWIAEGGSAAGLPAPAAASRRRRGRAGWIAAAVISVFWLGTLAWMWTASAAPGAPAAEVRFEVPGADVPTVASPSISPDGRILAYASRVSRQTAPVLTLRLLNDVTPRHIANTSDATLFFWSPDSRSVAYVANGRLNRAEVAGGLVRPICDLPDGQASFGGAWSPDDQIVFSAGGTLYRVPASGGEPVALERAGDGARAQNARWPTFLPDGRTFLYLGWSANEDRNVMAASFDDPVGRPIFANAVQVHYVRPGYLLFQNQTSLFAQPFDAETLSLTGEPVQVTDDLWPSLVAGRGTFTASAAGTVAYRAGGEDAAMADLVWADRRGGTLTTVGESRQYRQIALSPDERHVAFSQSEAASGRLELWTLDLATGVASRLTYGERPTDDPIWRPDGGALAYFSAVPEGVQVFEQVIGSRTASPMFPAGEEGRYPHDWSRDGRFLLFHRGNSLFVKSVGAEDPPRLLRQMQGSVDSGRFSPDGGWIAYGSNESGAWEVYVAPYPAFDRSRQVSTRGGVQARWRADSRELFYLEPDGRLMSVAVRPGGTGGFDADAPVPLFTSPIGQPSATIDQWSTTRDGQRFLFIRLQSPGSAAPIRVIANWQPPAR